MKNKRNFREIQSGVHKSVPMHMPSVPNGNGLPWKGLRRFC